jgi:hypothetical protein
MTSASTSGLCDWNKCLLQSRDAKTCDAIMAIVDAGKKSWTVQGHVLPLLMLMRRLKRSRPLPKAPLGLLITRMQCRLAASVIPNGILAGNRESWSVVAISTSQNSINLLKWASFKVICQRLLAISFMVHLMSMASKPNSARGPDAFFISRFQI